MLRLAGFKSDAVQKVITEQMIWGFREMFGIDIGGRPKKEKVKDFLYRVPHINTDDGISEINLQGITRRLEEMYKNLTKEQEYTSDEFGEFLMDECLLYFGERISEADWKEYGTLEQHQDIYEMCLAYANDAAPEEDNEGYDVKKEAESLCRAIFYLPDLAYDKGHEDVLFWDGDFLWYRGWNAMTGALRVYGYVRCAQLTESM